MNKFFKAAMAAVMTAAILMAGCGEKENVNSAEDTQATVSVQAENDAKEQETAASAETTENVDNSVDVTVRVGGLKGPTSIGLLALKDDYANGNTALNYEFTMATAADEITTALVKGELDIALIPANLASVLYNKTQGNISVIDINTLGVLYMVSGDAGISEPADLKGRTVYLTGKGTTPDYVLQYILKSNNLTDEVKLEYKSEATEVAAVLADNPAEVGLLPQPFVTAACAKNEALGVVMSMEEEWNKTVGDSGSRLVTGVTVVSKDFLNTYPEAVQAFMQEHCASVEAVSKELDRVAGLAVDNEIIGAEGVAKKAIPNCNIVYIDGNEMKAALSGYLSVLYENNPASVGGNMPDEDFYYIFEK